MYLFVKLYAKVNPTGPDSTGKENKSLNCGDIVYMRGSRKFCQRGYNFFSHFFFFYSVYEGKDDPNNT